MPNGRSHWAFSSSINLCVIAVHQMEHFLRIAPDDDPGCLIQAVEGELEIMQIFPADGIAEKLRQFPFVHPRLCGLCRLRCV